MSSELIIVRHALAQGGLGDDFSRPLTGQGLADAARAGQWLAGSGLQPSRLVSSPARRAIETAQALATALGGAAIKSDARIYEASTTTLLAVLSANIDASPLLLVGHNPGLENLLAALLGERNLPIHGMTPGTCVWLQLPEGADLWQTGSARLLRHWQP